MTAEPRYFDVVIVGAGHAGTTVATELRAGGYSGSIALVSAEPHLPYERPPLSKGFLLDELSEEQLLLRDTDYWTESEIELVLGSRVTRLDASLHRVWIEGGETLEYGNLVWAAGGVARELEVPGEHLPEVHRLRTLDDAHRLRESAAPGRRHVIVGGGFIGLEAAAVLATHGGSATVLEFEQRLLGRVTGEAVSAFFARRHVDSGVDLRFGAKAVAITGDSGSVEGVLLDSGEEIPADDVLVAVGLLPVTDVLLEAGAVATNGIEIDAEGRTSLPDVFAAGDCTSFEFPAHPSGRLRLESLQNAVEQAKATARAILGERPQPRPTPWFWSNQYDVKFKTVGVLIGHDTAVIRGDQDSGRFSVVYLREGRILAVDTINNMRDYVAARSLIGAAVDPEEVGDSSRSLKELVSTPVAE